MISIRTLSERVSNAVKTEVIKVTNSKDGLYSIWKYDKNMVADDDEEYGVFRSVIFSAKTGDLLCYAPEKSMPITQFSGTSLIAGQQPNLCVTETVEGTMINLFWNPDIEKWEIATRSGVGGNYWYNRTQYGHNGTDSNKQKTFRQMFIDCLKGDLSNTNIDHVPGVQYLSRDYCYSFVIQHPDNHFVYHIRSPAAYLVSVYKLSRDERPDAKAGDYVAEWIDYGKVCEETNQLVYAQTAAALGCVSIDILYNKLDLLEKFESAGNVDHAEWFNSPYPMGYMIVNRDTGRRHSIENENYAKIKELRGNNPNLQYQYLALNRANKVSEFLVYFPQYKKQFYAFYKQYHEFITEIHNAYVNYYIMKQRDQIPKKYFVHVSKIHHNIYLPSLTNGTKQVITHRVVREYFDGLSPSSQIYYLNLEQ